MKKTFITLALILVSATAIFAQKSAYFGSATFVTEEGENFTLYINNAIQNAKPAPSVKVEALADAFIGVKIVFENTAIPEIKKTIMRGGIDCFFSIQKNKKGEYVVKTKSCVGAFANAQATTTTTAPTSPQEAAGVTTTTQSTAAPSGPIKATITDNMISIGDARRFWFHKGRTPGNMPQPIIKMTQPEGAKVTITYDDNSETYSSEIPFVYEVKDYNNNNSYFKVTVDEGNDKVWYFRLQNGTSYQITIDTNAFD